MAIQVLLLPILIFGYFVVPEGASRTVIWAGLAVFYWQALPALNRPDRLAPGIKSYLTVELLFLVFSFTLFFLPYQLYALGLFDLARSRYFENTFASQSNKAFIISLVAVIAFQLGNNRRRNGTIEETLNRPSQDADNYRSLVWIVLSGQIVVMGAYLALGLRSASEGRYDGSTAGGGTAEALSLLALLLCMVSVAYLIVRTYQNLPVALPLKMCVIISLLWSVRLLLEGDRNSFALVAILALGGACAFRWNLSRVGIAVALIVGLSTYNAVGVYRGAEDRSVSALAAAYFDGDARSSTNGEDNSFNITTVGVRAAIDSVPSTYEYGLGRYKLIGILGVFPLVRGIFIDSSDATSTSQILKAVLLRPNASWGVGSNVVSDIFIDFGALGVPLLMYILGRVGSWARSRVTRSGGSTASIVVYLVLFALLAEMPRYSFDFPIRLTLWSAILVAIAGAIGQLSSRSKRAVAARIRSPELNA